MASAIASTSARKSSRTGDAARLDAEVLARLVEGGVGRHRQHDVGRVHVALVRGSHLGGLHRHEDRLGAAGREEPREIVVDVVAAEQRGGDLDDIVRHAPQRREDVGVQRVVPQVRVVGRGGQLLERLVGMEDQPEHAAVPEVLVVDLERLELAQHVVGGAPLRRKLPHKGQTRCRGQRGVGLT